MTVVAQVSDLHLDFYDPATREAIVEDIAGQAAFGADILLICGDTIEARTTAKTVKVMELFCSRFKQVLLVCGNHEYYKSYPHLVHNRFQAVEQKFSNFKFLNNSFHALPSGKKILGGTMWFRRWDDSAPYVPMYASNSDPRSRMNDFRTIRKFEPWVYEQQADFEKMLMENCSPGDVVMTHHAPHPCQIVEHFRYSDLNKFYVCDMTKVIEQKKPSHWFHGHMHTPMINEVGGCYIISNPHGYPFECLKEYPVVKWKI